ncbi:MAG: class I SAM-dependent methyltransferase [Candidatus Ancaeobacter aquaticus]|nr:class I SAM-dependent methyltransferase [Candidatus Ancaeobacter aquaticus]
MSAIDKRIELYRKRLKGSALYPIVREALKYLRKLNRPQRFNVYHRNVSEIRKKFLKNNDIKVLNLGCGLRQNASNVINIDIIYNSNVNIVSDAHYLPFADSVFDAVWFEAVLEHLKNPYQAKNEILRTLKSEGYLYLEIPFFQGEHDTPYDYQRFTMNGLRNLFGDFDIIEMQVVSGPASALSHTLRHFLSVLFSFNTQGAYKFFNGYIFSYVTFWIKYFDYFIINNINSRYLCFGYSLLCQKR